MDVIKELTDEIVAFRNERDWAQFHTARNLATSISVEAGELLECFQWAPGHSPTEPTEHEIADIAIYLLLFCYETGIDLSVTIRRKLKVNGAKYPVDKAKGKAIKHDKL